MLEWSFEDSDGNIVDVKEEMTKMEEVPYYKKEQFREDEKSFPENTQFVIFMNNLYVAIREGF